MDGKMCYTLFKTCWEVGNHIKEYIGKSRLREKHEKGLRNKILYLYHHWRHHRQRDMCPQLLWIGDLLGGLLP